MSVKNEFAGGAWQPLRPGTHESHLTGEKCSACAALVQVLRRRRLVEHLYKLGPEPVGHFLRELGDESGCADAIDRKLDEYARINPEFVKVNHGNQFPQMPYLIDGGRR